MESNILPHTPLENNIPPMMEDTTEDEGNNTTLQEDSTLDVTVEEFPSPQVQQSTVRQRLPKGVDKPIHYINARKKIKNIRQAPDDIDMFFGNASISVKKLLRRQQNRIKRDVLDLISQAEEENELLSSATPPVYPSHQEVHHLLDSLTAKQNLTASELHFRKLALCCKHSPTTPAPIVNTKYS